MASQKHLFDQEPVPERRSDGLILSSRPDRPLTKAQRGFNRLVAKVEKLRAELDNTMRLLDESLAYYGKHLHPRIERQNALRKDFVRALLLFLDTPDLKRKVERNTLRRILEGQLDTIMQQEGSLADDDLRAAFKRLHNVDFAEAEREGMDQARSLMEEMFSDLGIDVDLSGFHPGMKEEDFAARAAEMAGAFEEKTEEARHATQERKRPRTKRQSEQEERQRRAEEIRKKSIATIYKQLARVLHPDLEPDAGRRELKVTLMQELTAAYRNNDLHTLLRLELEWIQREEGDLDRLTDEKLAVYNDVLKEQVWQLEEDLADLPFLPRYAPIAQADAWEGVRLRTDGPAEAIALDHLITKLEDCIAALQSDQALDALRGMLQEYRDEERAPKATRRARAPRGDAHF